MTDQRFTATIQTRTGEDVVVAHDAYGRVTLSIRAIIVGWYHGSAYGTGSDEFLAIPNGIFVNYYSDRLFISREEIAKAQDVLREWMAAHPNEY